MTYTANALWSNRSGSQADQAGLQSRGAGTRCQASRSPALGSPAMASLIT
ncbi:hypothetical protein SCP_1503010 [Sparassis crispa]|uniref:Uncharacterized protein n=1 Tax=Sparassis crispa TaxID=139825 RepID=A0A401H4G5_9APHY|nr:hypothetical protein SCP_1503010 [Sparassis crispa]GBE89293.1 hypothetical protein SCP_1503010 [Sparassis crispa]